MHQYCSKDHLNNFFKLYICPQYEFKHSVSVPCVVLQSMAYQITVTKISYCLCKWWLTDLLNLMYGVSGFFGGRGFSAFTVSETCDW